MFVKNRFLAAKQEDSPWFESCCFFCCCFVVVAFCVVGILVIFQLLAVLVSKAAHESLKTFVSRHLSIYLCTKCSSTKMASFIFWFEFQLVHILNYHLYHYVTIIYVISIYVIIIYF